MCRQRRFCIVLGPQWRKGRERRHTCFKRRKRARQTPASAWQRETPEARRRTSRIILQHSRFRNGRSRGQRHGRGWAHGEGRQLRDRRSTPGSFGAMGTMPADGYGRHRRQRHAEFRQPGFEGRRQVLGIGHGGRDGGRKTLPRLGAEKLVGHAGSTWPHPAANPAGRDGWSHPPASPVVKPAVRLRRWILITCTHGIVRLLHSRARPAHLRPAPPQNNTATPGRRLSSCGQYP